MKKYNNRFLHNKLFLTVLFLLVIGAAVSVAQASHSWGNYHWGRTANPFQLQLGNNVTSNWDAYLNTTASDWSKSSVLNTISVPGATNPKNCRPTNGRVEVCNNRYGNNGWLGIAQIWISGSHITQGVVKVNDTYFNTSTYNKPEWRNFVMCQEVGHTLGLDHQDEDFYNANLGTCMDYTNSPASNQHPNAHDFSQLESIYAHLDSVNTVLASTADNGGSGGKGRGKGQIENVGGDLDFNESSNWGEEVRKDAKGRGSLHVRQVGKDKVFTFVIWAN